MEWNFTEYFIWNGEFFLEISQCVPKLAKLAVFTNLLLTARLEFILGKQSPFFVTTQLAGSGSEAQSFYKLGDSMTQIVTHLIVTQDFESWELRWGNNCNQSFLSRLNSLAQAQRPNLFYKLGDSMTQLRTHLTVTQDFESWELRWGNNCNRSFLSRLNQYLYELGDSMTQILSPESTIVTIVLPGWFSG